MKHTLEKLCNSSYDKEAAIKTKTKPSLVNSFSTVNVNQSTMGSSTCVALYEGDYLLSNLLRIIAFIYCSLLK
jgi:hypothetical protein